MNNNKAVALFLSAAFALGVAGCSVSQTVDTTTHDKFIAEAEQKAQAAMETLGDDGWSMDARTEVISIPLENAQGDTIIYHAFKTTYYNTTPTTSEELNIPAFHSVIDPDKAESVESCPVSGRPGALYDKDGRRYLCWTISPKYSLAIEYTPGTVSDADILEMA